jgi:hypothetical protein
MVARCAPTGSTVGVTRRSSPSERLVEPVPGSENHLVARRVLQPLEGLLHRLRPADPHGHRTLFADHLLIAHLVAFFSPALKSLRRIEDVFNHAGARRKYGLPRLPHRTVSDAHALFDPAVLTPLIADLRARVVVWHAGRRRNPVFGSPGEGCQVFFFRHPRLATFAWRGSRGGGVDSWERGNVGTGGNLRSWQPWAAPRTVHKSTTSPARVPTRGE